MENFELIGNHALSLIAAISPTALMATLGLLVLALACASIGWILNNDSDHGSHSYEAQQKKAHLALPDMRDENQNGSVDLTDLTQSNRTSTTASARALDGSQDLQPDISLTDSTGSTRSGLLNATLANTARGLKSLQPGNKKQQSEIQEKLRNFEIELRSTQYKLDTREAELREFRSRATTEIKAARAKIKGLESQQAAHKNSKSQILKLTEANNQLRNERDTLKTKVQSEDEALQNKKLTLLNTEFETKIFDLEKEISNQKAQSQDLEAANQELLSKVDDLKSAKIDAENAKDEFSKRFTQSQAERDAGAELLQANLDEKTKRVTTLETQLSNLTTESTKLKDSVAKVEEELKQAKQRHTNTSEELTKNTAKTKSLETELKIGQAQQQSLENSLNEQTRACDLATRNLASLEEKRTIYREETSREITNLRKQVTQLQSLEIANKNQTTTIRKLEEQISDARRRRVKQDENGVKLAQTIIENERLTKELDAKGSELTQTQTKLGTLESEKTQKIQEIEQINKQFEQIKNENVLAQRKNDDLRKTVSELEHLRRDTKRQTSHIETLENELKETNSKVAQAETLAKQLSDNQKKLSDLNENKASLEIALDKSEEQATRYEAKSTGLIAEVERAKSANETIVRSRDELANTVKSLESQITQHRASSEKAKDDVQALEDSHRKTIADKDSLTSELQKRKELLESELAAQQVSYKQIEKQWLNGSKASAQIESELKLKDKQNESFKRQLEDSRLLERQHKERIAKLEMQLTASKSRKTEYEEQISANKQTIESMQATHSDALKKETAKINELLEASEAKASKTVEELKQQKQKTDTYQLEIKSLKNKHSDEILTAVRENRSQQESQFNAQLETQLQKQQAQLQEEHTRNLELATAETTKQVEQKSIIALEKASNAAKSSELTIVKLNSQINEQQIELKDQKQKLLKTENSLSESLGATEKQKQSIGNITRDLEISRSALDQERKLRTEQTRTINSEAESKISKLQARLKSASQELADNQNQLKKLERESSSRENDLSTLKATIAERDSAQANVEKYKVELSSISQSIETERKSLQQQAQTDKNRLSSELTSERQARSALIEQLKQNDTQKQDLSNKLEQATKNLVLRDKSILALQRENEQFESLKGVVAERQADIESLREKINKLAVLEKKLLEKDVLLKNAQNELHSARKSETEQQKKSDTLRKSLDEANKTIARRIQSDESQTQADTEEGDAIELNRLNAQVVSLTTERDLGLQRVKELSEVVKQVKEKDILIRELRSGITSSKISDRELELLRSRIDSQDADLRNKKLTIEQLKRQLTQLATSTDGRSKTAKTGSSKSPYGESKGLELLEGMTGNGDDNNGDGALTKAKPVKKSQVKQQNTQTSSKTTVNKKASEKVSIKSEEASKPFEKDDLKTINGIGPKLENQLNAMGIASFRQIAEFSPSDVIKVSESLAFPGRIERDNWIDSAKKLYIEKYKSR